LALAQFRPGRIVTTMRRSCAVTASSSSFATDDGARAIAGTLLGLGRHRPWAIALVVPASVWLQQDGPVGRRGARGGSRGGGALRPWR
jgi:hypothetical protein